jgi:hypothetical protein
LRRVKQFFVLLESFITVVLVLAGVAGIGYRIFREGGWLAQGFGKFADVFVDHPLIVAGLALAAFFLCRYWIDRRNQGRRGKLFDYLVYVFMAAGIYFIGYYVLTGKV